MESVIKDVPHVHLLLLTTYLRLFPDNITDFRAPYLRDSVLQVYPLYIALYALIVLLGTGSNVCLLATIVRQRLYKDPVHYFLCNLAVSNLVQCLLVLPVTLFNLLVRNWVFGRLLCYLIPMMHYIPIYSSTLTFLAAVSYRYRLVFHPAFPPRVHCFLCCLFIWLLSVAVALPPSIFITYLDVGEYFPQTEEFRGVGTCVVNAEDNMEEYLRWLFITLYVLPFAIIALLHVRLSREIKARATPLLTVAFEAVSADEPSDARSGSNTPCPARERWFDGEPHAATASATLREPEACSTATLLQRPSCGDSSVQWRAEMADEDQFDARKEKRAQKYLITMALLFATCLFPLEVIRLVKHGVEETLDNTGHFDLPFIILVWIGFLPTCITPLLFGAWYSDRPVKEKLKGYFRLGSHRHSSTMSIQRPPPSSGQGLSNNAFVHNGSLAKVAENGKREVPPRVSLT